MNSLDMLVAPLKLDPETGEPYLQLGPPFEHIVLTPQRYSDISAIVENLNDPRIYTTLSGPPLPYLEQHALDWLSRGIKSSEAALAALRAGSQYVDSVVVRSIRDTHSSGGSIANARLIGDCCIDRHGFDDVIDSEVSDRLSAENAAKEAGDPTIMWSVGDWIDTAHQGQGIMTAVVQTLIHQYCVPRMNATRIRASAFIGNRASVRVFEKNGFKNMADVLDVVELSEARGGGRVGLHVLEWSKPHT